MIDRVEFIKSGRVIVARCESPVVSASGPARPSNAAWEIQVGDARIGGPPAEAEDTAASTTDRIRAWLDGHPNLVYSAPERVEYGGCWIEPMPKELRDSGEWTLDIQVGRDCGRELRVKPFTARNTFGTRDEAIAEGTRFGQCIIDGAVPGCSVADL